MRHNPNHAVTDASVVRRLIAENPWATIISHNGEELVASHCPVLLDDRAAQDELAIVTHLGRPDERIHSIRSEEVLLIVAGPHGYISPSWYGEDAIPVPTWNFSVAHCYGVPEVLGAEENLATLGRLVEHFEERVERPVHLDHALGERLAPGTCGIRMTITRFTCKVKMSQDKDVQSQRHVLQALRRPGPYHNPQLADDMHRVLTGDGDKP